MACPACIAAAHGCSISSCWSLYKALKPARQHQSECFGYQQAAGSFADLRSLLLQGNVLVNGANNIVSRTADCCQACHAYMRNSTVSANRCNSYLFCESNGGAPCPLSVGGATLPAGGCQLQYSAAVEALAPAPVLGANLGGGIVSGQGLHCAFVDALYSMSPS